MQFLDVVVSLWSETIVCITDLMQAEIRIILIHTLPSWYTYCKYSNKAHYHIFSLHPSNLMRNR